MEENTKITFAKNMNKHNFNSTLNISVDSNANIKTILDINTFIYDTKIECGNGKAIINGKIGAKILYIDTDNLTNALSYNSPFSETYLDNNLTSDTILNIYSSNISNNILSMDGNLKISCDTTLNLISYINLPLTNNIVPTDSLITKRNNLTTNTISKVVNTKFEHIVNHETKDIINKILCTNSYFSCDKYSSQNGFIMIEGKLISIMLYESKEDDNIVVKQMKEVNNFKYDIECDGLTSEDVLDLTFAIDQFNQDISTEIEDNNSIVTIKHTINISGVSLQQISLDVIDDLFSTTNEIETTSSKREYTKSHQHFSLSETIANEISLNENETAIDDVVANLNMDAEITNTYIKENSVYIEGIATSNLTYIDENKEFKHKEIEIPFILNTKITVENLGCFHTNISVVDHHLKIKRGTIIEVEFSLFVNMSLYEKDNLEIISNYTIGKQLDFSKYDFQIYLAKPNETMWELCKRIKISPEEVHKLNKNLPLIMEGNEKIIIKR